MLIAGRPREIKALLCSRPVLFVKITTPLVISAAKTIGVVLHHLLFPHLELRKELGPARIKRCWWERRPSGRSRCCYWANPVLFVKIIPPPLVTGTTKNQYPGRRPSSATKSAGPGTYKAVFKQKNRKTSAGPERKGRMESWYKKRNKPEISGRAIVLFYCSIFM